MHTLWVIHNVSELWVYIFQKKKKEKKNMSHSCIKNTCMCGRYWVNIYSCAFESTHQAQRGLIQYRSQLCVHHVPLCHHCVLVYLCVSAVSVNKWTTAHVSYMPLCDLPHFLLKTIQQCWPLYTQTVCLYIMWKPLLWLFDDHTVT